MLEPLLKTLSDELLLDPSPIKEKNNTYTISLNPELAIQVQEIDPGLRFLGRIGPCPMAKKEELFMFLMKANFLGQGTGGSTIGLEENENFLTLSCTLPYDMNYKMFKDHLEDFANYLDYYKEELIRHKRMAEQSI